MALLGDLLFRLRLELQPYFYLIFVLDPSNAVLEVSDPTRYFSSWQLYAARFGMKSLVQWGERADFEDLVNQVDLRRELRWDTSRLSPQEMANILGEFLQGSPPVNLGLIGATGDVARVNVLQTRVALEPLFTHVKVLLVTPAGIPVLGAFAFASTYGGIDAASGSPTNANENGVYVEARERRFVVSFLHSSLLYRLLVVVQCGFFFVVVSLDFSI